MRANSREPGETHPDRWRGRSVRQELVRLDTVRQIADRGLTFAKPIANENTRETGLFA